MYDIPELSHWNEPPSESVTADLIATAEAAFARWDAVLPAINARLNIPKLTLSVSLKKNGKWSLMYRDASNTTVFAVSSESNPEIALVNWPQRSLAGLLDQKVLPNEDPISNSPTHEIPTTTKKKKKGFS